MSAGLMPTPLPPDASAAGGAAPAHRGRGRTADRTDDRAPDRAAEPASERKARRGRVVRRAALAVVALSALGAAASAPRWGPRALAHLAFFRVRRVEIEGARYATAGELVARLGVDTTTSVWTDLDTLAQRAAAHPMLAGAHVDRRLPGVLHVVVRERTPVAMAPRGPRGALVVYDAEGKALPIAPSRVGGVDVPLVADADPALLRVLGALRADAPTVYARVTDAARAHRAVPAAAAVPVRGAAARAAATTSAPVPEHDELVFPLGPAAGAAPGTPGVLVRAALDVTAARFADLAPVEDDLARRRVRPAELDLRFRDQVVARLPQ